MGRQRQCEREPVAGKLHVADLIHFDDASSRLGILEILQRRPHGGIVQWA